MSNFFEEWVNESEEHQKLVAQERLILEVTESIHEQMQAMGVNRTQLAKRLGKSKAYVSQLLSGSRNMTLRSLAAISFALHKDIPSFSYDACAETVYENGDWQHSGNVVRMRDYHARSETIETAECDTEDGWMRAVR